MGKSVTNGWDIYPVGVYVIFRTQSRRGIKPTCTGHRELGGATGNWHHRMKESLVQMPSLWFFAGINKS